MKKNIINSFIFLIFIALIGFVGFMAIQKSHVKKSTLLSKHAILFYSNKCPHCQHVEAFLKKHRLKISLEKLDVLKDRKNLQLLVNTANYCGAGASKNIGIPFLWTGKRCISGDVGVINYFKGQAK